MRRRGCDGIGGFCVIATDASFPAMPFSRGPRVSRGSSDRALPAAFSLLRSEFNDFLFAPVGNDDDHRTLSVLSALTRAGLDPWQQAARLERLPRGEAIETLASMLATLPGRACSVAETRAAAERLIALLPQRPSAKARLFVAMSRHVRGALVLLLRR